LRIEASLIDAPERIEVGLLERTNRKWHAAIVAGRSFVVRRFVVGLWASSTSGGLFGKVGNRQKKPSRRRVHTARLGFKSA
jgi:hypothetical protein